jgi:PKD domain
VTFTSTSTGTITSLAWDLDGDGACDDATGTTASRSFPTAGSYPVELCVNLGATTQKRTITVRNRPPRAYFVFSPGSPTEGEPVTVASTSVDLDGPIVRYAWDLDDDGAFDDSSAINASLSLGPGYHRVGLRVTDRDGASGAVYRPIVISSAAPELLRPFPVVRLRVLTTRGGVRVGLLGVRGPRGVRVSVRCRGRDCPWRRRSVVTHDGRVRFRRLQRKLRAGTVIEVLVNRPGSIGKYSRFTIRRGRPPARVDACLAPGATRPSACPD